MAISLLTTPALAEDQAASQTTIFDSTGESCFPRASFEAQLSSVLASQSCQRGQGSFHITTRFADSAPEDLAIAPKASALIGELTIFFDGTPFFSRRVGGDACSTIQDALTLALELHVQGCASTEAPSTEASFVVLDETDTPEPATEASPEPELLDPDSFPPDEDSPTSTTVIPEPKKTPTFALRVGPSLTYGSTPRPGVGAVLLAEARLFEKTLLVVDFGFDGRTQLGDGSSNGHLSSAHGFLGLGQRFPISPIFEARADLGGYAAWQHASLESADFGSDEVSAGIATHLEGLLLFAPGWTASLRGGINVPLRKGTYLDSNDETLWKQPSVGVSGSILLGWRFL